MSIKKQSIKEQTVEKIKKEVEDAPKPEPKAKSSAPVYTYVGGGEDSPRKINFMGLQVFVRGQAAEVTNPTVLAKIIINPSFVEGEVDNEELHEYDEKASKEAEEQRKLDRATDAAFKKKHHGE